MRAATRARYGVPRCPSLISYGGVTFLSPPSPMMHNSRLIGQVAVVLSLTSLFHDASAACSAVYRTCDSDVDQYGRGYWCKHNFIGDEW